MKKKDTGYSAVISVTLIALVSGFLLSFIYSLFAEDIRLNNELVVTEGIKSVIASATTIEGPITDNGTFPYYEGYGQDNNIVGYAFLANATGYNGTIKMLVGFDKDISYITAIVPTEQAETPGLGAKILDVDFKKQFENKLLEENLLSVKGIVAEQAQEYEIAAITGATVSTDAVIVAVNIAKEEALMLLGKE